jgi:hypothetical protein
VRSFVISSKQKFADHDSRRAAGGRGHAHPGRVSAEAFRSSAPSLVG